MAAPPPPDDIRATLPYRLGEAAARRALRGLEPPPPEPPPSVVACQAGVSPVCTGAPSRATPLRTFVVADKFRVASWGWACDPCRNQLLQGAPVAHAR